jgi:hypothetical protein
MNIMVRIVFTKESYVWTSSIEWVTVRRYWGNSRAALSTSRSNAKVAQDVWQRKAWSNIYIWSICREKKSLKVGARIVIHYPFLKKNSKTSMTRSSLVCSDLGSGNNVALEVVVDVGSVTRIGRLDMARDLGDRGRATWAATGDLELRAREVELRWRTGVVDAELLNAEQVVASGDLVGDSDSVWGCAKVSMCNRVLM